MHLMVLVTRSADVRLRTAPQSGQNSKREVESVLAMCSYRVRGAYSECGEGEAAMTACGKTCLRTSREHLSFFPSVLPCLNCERQEAEQLPIASATNHFKLSFRLSAPALTGQKDATG